MQLNASSVYNRRNIFRSKRQYICVPPKQKPPAPVGVGGFLNNSLTMTYFHTGCSTIIGAKSFHGPVRDGKGWYQLAMVIRHDLSVPWHAAFYAAAPSGNPNWKKYLVVLVAAAFWLPRSMIR